MERICPSGRSLADPPLLRDTVRPAAGRLPMLPRLPAVFPPRLLAGYPPRLPTAFPPRLLGMLSPRLPTAFLPRLPGMLSPRLSSALRGRLAGALALLLEFPAGRSWLDLLSWLRPDARLGALPRLELLPELGLLECSGWSFDSALCCPHANTEIATDAKTKIDFRITLRLWVPKLITTSRFLKMRYDFTTRHGTVGATVTCTLRVLSRFELWIDEDFSASSRAG